MKIFQWVYKPSGNCPIQAEGYFLGYFFYFRARHELATMDFYNDRGDFDNNAFAKPIAYIIVKTDDDYEAGWLSKKECTFLVFKGCFMFILNKIFNLNKKNRYVKNI